jgi:hypothetical protein
MGGCSGLEGIVSLTMLGVVVTLPYPLPTLSQAASPLISEDFQVPRVIPRGDSIGSININPRICGIHRAVHMHDFKDIPDIESAQDPDLGSNRRNG